MKVVLIDRDGTIIFDPPDERVDRVEKIKLFPDTIDALKFLAEHEYAIIIVTNQAGIAEGRLSEKEFWKIHSVVLEKIAPSGVKVLKTYMNGEASGTKSEWRKPGPGMLLKAAKDLNLKLSDIFMIGDHESDIQAGLNAGTKTILVKTANTNVEAPEATYVANDLSEAARYVVNH